MSNATKTSDAPSGARLGRRLWGWAILGAAVVFSALALGRRHASHEVAGASHQDAEKRAQADGPIPVDTTHLAKGGIARASTQVGTVHPYKEADLYAKVSGYLKELHVDYGDRVKRGQVLAEIDDPEVVMEAQRAASDLEETKAAV